MSFALEKFGLGEANIPFENARPGDVISFDRYRIDIEGKRIPSGHSVVFLAFLTRDQKEVLSYKKGEIVGFKYFSAQESEPAGLSERWAYFKVPEGRSVGICPYSDDKKIPTQLNKGYCPDAIDNVTNRKRFPLLEKGQPRDCCIIREGGSGPRVARLLMPQDWRYRDNQAKMIEKEKELKDNVREFMELVGRNSERLRLYAIGAIQLEKTKPKTASNYIQKLRAKFSIDLRSVADAPELFEVSNRALIQIANMTPREIIRLANEQVTEKAKKEMDRRVRAKAAAQAVSLRPRADGGAPNPGLDSQPID
jgi:hypothetical protein